MRLMRPCWSRSQRRSWRPFGWFRAPPTHVTDDDGDESLDTAAAMETKEGDDDDLGDDLDVDWSKKRRPRRKKKKKTKSAKQIKAMFKKRKARKKALEKQMRRLRTRSSASPGSCRPAGIGTFFVCGVRENPADSKMLFLVRCKDSDRPCCEHMSYSATTTASTLEPQQRGQWPALRTSRRAQVDESIVVDYLLRC